MMNYEVDICLATYNGDKYLPDLIRSIQNQSFKDWCLLVSDDGSIDSTLDILNEYFNRDSRILPILEGVLFHNATDHFLAILKQSHSSYAMFCDQDDVWLEDKIETSLKSMHDLEDRYGPDVPLLVFSDSTVVNEKLEVIRSSNASGFMFDPNAISLSRLMISNVAQGCTILMNRAARKLINSIERPSSFDYHDHWAAASVMAAGHIYFLDRSTVLYRQHGSNVVGADFNSSYFHMLLNGLHKIFERGSFQKMFSDETRFCRRAQDLLALDIVSDPEKRKALRRLSVFNSLPLGESIRVIRQEGLIKMTSPYGKVCQLIGIFGSRWF